MWTPWKKKVAELEARILDLERHFATKRDEDGQIVETLADVPLKERDKLKKPDMRGAPWPQRRAYLEATDGGRMNG